MNHVVLVALLAVCVCTSFAAPPTRPVISQTFHADVHVSVTENGRVLSGGGLFAYDVPKGLSRTDLTLEDDSHKTTTIHILDRYDLHATYEIFDFTACKKTAVTGSLPSPWAWVATANYNGTSNFQGKVLDVWVYTSDTVSRKLMVDSQSVNTPVFVSTRTIVNKVTNVMDLTVFRFDPTEPAAWVFTVPKSCEGNLTAGSGDAGSVVYFANANWNCGNVVCSYRVPDGAAQPGYACAEFVARSLAAGGYMQSLHPSDPQSAYANHNGYNLCVTTSLSSFLGAIGYTKRAASPGAVQAAYAAFGDGGDGYFSHACIGVGSGTDDCHNIARINHAASGSFFKGVDAVWSPPGL